ncbi:hypothetical protein [uncultured Flavobacterium sp.]|uniref:hypothetical protein n=1 Tax=uncultured Flavobacterium sp. TaxID=165435 RepID=UPI0030EC9902
MMLDLINKAKNEKYYQSIRFFYHSLSMDKRHDFVRLVAEYNIYLAAQCIMTSQKDSIIESEIIGKAEYLAKDFNNPESSAKGFLALAEFEQFILISKLLKNVQKPTKQQLIIFKKIFESNGSQDIFFQLIEVMLLIENIQLIIYCITTYNGTIIVNTENQKILKTLFLFLFDNGNYGISKVILEKFELYNEIAIIFEKQPTEIINILLVAKRKKIQAIKLAYEIYNRFNLVKSLNAEIFIDILNETSSDKSLMTAINIATRQHIESKRINEEISNLLNPFRNNQKVINRVMRKVTQLINNGLLDYISKNESLNEQFSRFKETFNYDFEKKKNLHGLITSVFIKSEYSIFEDNVEIPTHKSIEEVIEDYFNMKDKPYLENLVNMLTFHFNASYRDISHLLRKYELCGTINAIFDYGYYVTGENIKTRNLFFLHPAQAFEIGDENNNLEENSKINFRIIGINRTNLRFNISRLKEFQN